MAIKFKKCIATLKSDGPKINLHTFKIFERMFFTLILIIPLLIIIYSLLSIKTALV